MGLELARRQAAPQSSASRARHTRHSSAGMGRRRNSLFRQLYDVAEDPGTHARASSATRRKRAKRRLRWKAKQAVQAMQDAILYNTPPALLYYNAAVAVPTPMPTPATSRPSQWSMPQPFHTCPWAWAVCCPVTNGDSEEDCGGCTDTVEM